MSPPTVACLSPSFGVTSSAAIAEIEAAGAVLVGPQGVDDRVLGSARGLIVGTQRVDAELLARAPNLTVVAKHGAGIDNIDLEAAKAAGIAVTCAPGANATAVAELTLGLIIALARGIVLQDARVRQGRWSVAIGKALEGSTLGVIGLGRIGKLVASRAAAFEMRVLAHDVVAQEADASVSLTDLDTLLRTSDFVTVHVPLTPDTAGLIDAAALRLMKPTAYLINAARGRIVDEAALDHALSVGEIAGAALDVFEAEPLDTSHPLVSQRERTILTPHMAAYSDRALADTSMVTARNIVAALAGTWPPDAVNRP